MISDCGMNEKKDQVQRNPMVQGEIEIKRVPSQLHHLIVAHISRLTICEMEIDITTAGWWGRFNEIVFEKHLLKL